MPKGFSDFSFRKKKIFEESVRNLMNCFGSYALLFVRAVCCYLRWPRLCEQKITAPTETHWLTTTNYLRYFLYICVFHIWQYVTLERM